MLLAVKTVKRDWSYVRRSIVRKSLEENLSRIGIKIASLRKQPTFREVATWALAKRRLSNERRNSILMTRH